LNSPISKLNFLDETKQNQLKQLQFNSGIGVCGHKTITIENLSSLKMMFSGFPRS
jgi:hypothetical protein